MIITTRLEGCRMLRILLNGIIKLIILKLNLQKLIVCISKLKYYSINVQTQSQHCKKCWISLKNCKN